MHTLTRIAATLAITLAATLPATLVTGLALAAGTPPALAGNGSTPAAQRQVVLQYQRADLASPGSLEHTYLRMTGAARQVCEPYSGRGLARQRVFQRCVDATLAAAVAAVHDPRLTALHDAHAPPLKLAAAPLRTAQR